MRKRYIALAVIMLALGLFTGITPAVAVPTGPALSMCVSSAPNVFGSPSWADYNSNALAALQNGCPSTGDPLQPTFYESKTTFSPGEMMVTSFNSWKGVTSPPAPFNNELGNRLYFGLDAFDSLTKFSLSMLSFDMNSSDPGNAFDFDGNFIGSTYNERRVGVDWVDGIKGNGNDIVYDAGQSAALLVNELIYSGIGNAFWPGAPDDPTSTFQSITEYMLANGDFKVDVTYTLGTSSVHGVATVPAPEPATLVLLGLGLGIGAMMYRRQRR